MGTNDEVMGAGDQGMMFGYGCNDNDLYLPTAMVILQELSRKFDILRKSDSRFKSDGKAQITGYYSDDMKLLGIKTFTISYQNTEKERLETDKIIKDICDHTGRKIVVDSYEGFAPVGGGAFSGKDPTKVDRSGAYKARLIAIHYLKKYNLKWCKVQLSYSIGIRKPIAIYIDSDKGILLEEVTIEKYKDLYEECKPKNIIDDLNLLNEIF